MKNSILPLGIVGLILGFGLLLGRSSYRQQAEQPNDYVEYAQRSDPEGRTISGRMPKLTTTNLSVLSDACSQLEWKAVEPQGKGYIVEANGILKRNGQPVQVRWLVLMLRQGNVTVVEAQPKFASVGGVEVTPASNYPAKLVEDVVK